MYGFKFLFKVLVCLLTSGYHSGLCHMEIDHHLRPNDFLSVKVTSFRTGWSVAIHSTLTNETVTNGATKLDQTIAYFNNTSDRTYDTPVNVNEGLVLTVLNPRNGEITFEKIFKLWQFWAEWDNFLRYLSYLPSGRILVFTFSGQGSAGLREAKTHLKKMGSLFASHLSMNSTWVWAVSKGGKTFAESCPVVGQHTVEVDFLIPLYTDEKTSVNPQQMLVNKFCDQNELMGELCDPDFDFETFKPLINIEFPYLRDIPIIINAGSRIGYFSHTIRKLLRTPGIIKKNIIVILGGEKKKFIDLVRFLDIKYIVLTMYGLGNGKLFQYYRRSYKYVRDHYSHSKAAIFLDEDVEVSIDFLNYMNQTIPAMVTDPTLYCVNGFATARSANLGIDAKRVVRSEAQVAWGYAVSLEFIGDALKEWPTDETVEALFDQFLMKNISEGKECIIPEYSRTVHFGTDGVNSKSNYDTEFFLLNIPVVPDFGHVIENIDQISKKEYDTHLENDILNATILRTMPCSDDFLPKNASGSFVFYYLLEKFTNQLQFVNFYVTGLCLGLWSMSVQALHDGISTFKPTNTTILHLIPVPYSDFSALRIPNEPVFDMMSIPIPLRKKLFSYHDSTAILERNKFFQNQSIRIPLAMEDLFQTFTTNKLNWNFNVTKSNVSDLLDDTNEHFRYNYLNQLTKQAKFYSLSTVN